MTNLTDTLADIQARRKKSGLSLHQQGKLLAAVEAVVGVHYRDYFNGNPGALVCYECVEHWPCQTIRALSEGLGVEG